MSASADLDGCFLASGTGKAGPLIRGLIGDWLRPYSDADAERLRSRSAPDPIIERRLAQLGQPLAWAFWGRDVGETCGWLRRFAATHPVFGRALSQSPPVPEAAMLVARAIERGLDENKGKILVRADLELVGLALAHRGHDVTLLCDVSGDPTIFADDDAVTVVHDALAEGVPAAHRDAYDAVVFDLHPNQHGLTLETARALRMVKPGGLLGVVAHQQQREAMIGVRGLLPCDEVDTLAELVARVAPGFVVEDDFSDLWLMRRHDAEVPYAPDKPVTALSAERLDSDLQLIWAGEMLDFVDDIDPERHLAPALDWLRQAGILAPLHELANDDARHLRRNLPLPGGRFIELQVDRRERVVGFAIAGWQPALFVQVGAALLLHLPRQRICVEYEATP